MRIIARFSSFHQWFAFSVKVIKPLSTIADSVWPFEIRYFPQFRHHLASLFIGKVGVNLSTFTASARIILHENDLAYRHFNAGDQLVAVKFRDFVLRSEAFVADFSHW
jgi:hypothetical protein